MTLYYENTTEPYNLEEISLKNVSLLFEKAYTLTAWSSEPWWDKLCKYELQEVSEPVQLLNHTIEIVEQVGGYESETEDYWYVFSVTDNLTGEKRLFRWSGWYASYSGGELNTLEEVKLREKTILVYEAI